MTSFRTTHPDILSTSNGGIYHYIPLQANQPGTWLTTISMTIEKDGSARSYADVDFNLPQLPLKHVVHLSKLVNNLPFSIHAEWTSEKDNLYFATLEASSNIGNIIIKDIVVTEVLLSETQSKQCSCELGVLMNRGCQCGGE